LVSAGGALRTGLAGRIHCVLRQPGAISVRHCLEAFRGTLSSRNSSGCLLHRHSHSGACRSGHPHSARDLSRRLARRHVRNCPVLRLGPAAPGLGVSRRGRYLDNCTASWNAWLLQLLCSLVDYGQLCRFGRPRVRYQCYMAVDRGYIGRSIRVCNLTKRDARGLLGVVGGRRFMVVVEGIPPDAAPFSRLGGGGLAWAGLLFFAGRLATAQPRAVVCRRPVGRRAVVPMARQRADGDRPSGRWLWPGSLHCGVSTL